MKKATLILLISMAASLLMILVVWFFPSIVFNAATLKWAADKYFPDYSLRFEQLDVDFETLSFFSKEINIDAQGICVEFQGAGVAFDECVDELALSLDASFSLFSATVDRLESITIKKEDSFDLNVQLAATQKENESPEEFSEDSLAHQLHLAPLVEAYQNCWKVFQTHYFRERPQLNVSLPQFTIHIQSDSRRRIDLSVVSAEQSADEASTSSDLVLESQFWEEEKMMGSARGVFAAKGFEMDLNYKISDLAELHIKAFLEEQTPLSIDVKAFSDKWDFLDRKMLELSAQLEEDKGTLKFPSHLKFSSPNGLLHIRNKGCVLDF